MSRDDAERLAWSVGNDARAAAEHAAEFVAMRDDLATAADMLMRAVQRIDRLAGAPINELAL